MIASSVIDRHLNTDSRQGQSLSACLLHSRNSLRSSYLNVLLINRLIKKTKKHISTSTGIVIVEESVNCIRQFEEHMSSKTIIFGVLQQLCDK